MKSFTDLPDLVICRVYTYLTRIDDKQHLAAACHRLRQLMFTADSWLGCPRIHFTCHSNVFTDQTGCGFLRLGDSQEEHVITGHHRELLAFLARERCREYLHVEFVFKREPEWMNNEKLKNFNRVCSLDMSAVMQYLDIVGSLTIHVGLESTVEKMKTKKQVEILSAALSKMKNISSSETHLLLRGLSENFFLPALLRCAQQELPAITKLTLDELTPPHFKEEISFDLENVTDLHLSDLSIGLRSEIAVVQVQKFFAHFPNLQNLHITFINHVYGNYSKLIIRKIVDLMKLRPEYVRELTIPFYSHEDYDHSDLLQLIDTVPQCKTLILYCRTDWVTISSSLDELESSAVRFINSRSEATNSTEMTDWFFVLTPVKSDSKTKEIEKFCRKQSEEQTTASCASLGHISEKWELFDHICTRSNSTISELFFDKNLCLGVFRGRGCVAVFSKQACRYHICFDFRDDSFWNDYYSNNFGINFGF